MPDQSTAIRVRCHHCGREIYSRINMRKEREWLTYAGYGRRQRLICNGMNTQRHTPGQQP